MFKLVDCTVNDKETKKPRIYGLVILSIIATILLSSCSSGPENPPNHSHARPYEVLNVNVHMIAGREHREYKIYSPGSATIDERAHTGMRAALYFENGTEPQIIYVRLYTTTDAVTAELPLALVHYAPDGGGISGTQDWTWKVKTVSEGINHLELQVKKYWEANEHEFIESDGLVNKEKLTSFIANQLDIPVNKVTFPLLNAKAYEPVFN